MNTVINVFCYLLASIAVLVIGGVSLYGIVGIIKMLISDRPDDFEEAILAILLLILCLVGLLGAILMALIVIGEIRK